MRVKWREKLNARGSAADIPRGSLETWQGEIGGWVAEYLHASGNVIATHYSLPSERAAKREAVRMWRALRGGK